MNYSMTDEIKSILKLKEPVMTLDGKPVKNLEKVERANKDGTPKSIQEMTDSAPVLTRGELLANILFGGVRPTTPSEAATLNRLARKVQNVMSKDKGEWAVEKKTILELVDMINKVPPEVIQVGNIGEIIVMLEDTLEEIMTKELAAKVKSS